MEHKRYLDKVIDYMVRGTDIDYDNELISPPSLLLFYPLTSLSFSSNSRLPYLFYSYCKDIFGLTKEEIDYVWKEYKKIILDKINQ